MCVRLPHACQRFVTLLMRNAIYTFGKKYTRWEAVFPGKFVAVLTLLAHLQASNLHGTCPGGVGLTTALVVLERGWVIVGSLPTSNGMSATAKAGCLIVLNSNGTAVETFSGQPINGPWDMTAFDRGSQAELFVTNVLNGTVAANGKVVKKATVVRIELKVPNQGNGAPEVESTTIIGSGFSARTDPAALVLGPTGVGLSSNGTLYVADTVNNRIKDATLAWLQLVVFFLLNPCRSVLLALYCIS
jgi:NHL repeat-containing protein